MQSIKQLTDDSVFGLYELFVHLSICTTCRVWVARTLSEFFLLVCVSMPGLSMQGDTVDKVGDFSRS
jgi:hypothetical protein